MDSSQAPEVFDEPDNRTAALRSEKLKSKKVLKELREHSEQLDQDKVQALDPRSEVLANHFTRASENVNKTKTVDQALLDAQIFYKLSEYSKRQATQLQTGLKNYDVSSFVDSLALIMRESSNRGEDNAQDDMALEEGDQELDLHSLGRGVWNRYRTFPSVQFMYGNSNIQPRMVKPRKAVKRAKKGTNVVKPSELTSEDVVQTEADRQIRQMKGELQKREELNFWEFVIDPESYTRSIENVFHSSFLVKDGHAKLDLGVEPPTISFHDVRNNRSNSQRALVAQEEEFAQNAQFIMRFDYKTWLEMREKYKISNCILPSSNAPRWQDLLPRAQELFEGNDTPGGSSANQEAVQIEPTRRDSARSGGDTEHDADEPIAEDNDSDANVISD